MLRLSPAVGTRCGRLYHATRLNILPGYCLFWGPGGETTGFWLCPSASDAPSPEDKGNATAIDPQAAASDAGSFFGLVVVRSPVDPWLFVRKRLYATVRAAGIGVVEVQKPMVFAISAVLARPSAGIGVVEVQKPMVFCDF